MIAAMQTTLAIGPSITLRVAEPLRRRQLERDLAAFAVATGPDGEGGADVMVLHLGVGQVVPADAASFDGALLVLSDDAAIARDASLQGVLPATAAGPQIAAAIGALAEGLTVRQWGRLPGLPDPAGFAPPEAASRPLLTPRELEVLALVGEGMSNKTIAPAVGDLGAYGEVSFGGGVYEAGGKESGGGGDAGVEKGVAGGLRGGGMRVPALR